MTAAKLKRMVIRWTTQDLADALIGKCGNFYPAELGIIRKEYKRRILMGGVNQ